MSGLPIGVFFPFIALGLVVFMLMRRKAATARTEQQYAGFRASEIATKLGLAIVEGDPSFNLFVTQAHGDIARGPRDGRPVRLRLHMRGSREGLPLELIYDLRWEMESGLASTTWRKWLDCRLIVTVNRPFPAFEVTSLRALPAPIVPVRALPRASTGNATIDQAYAVATTEPRLAEVLATSLDAFAFLGDAGAHLVGDGSSVSFVMHPDKAPMLSSVLFYGDRAASALVRVGRAIGG